MKRLVSVTATCSFDFEIDDEAVSDWDGAKILEVLDKRRDNDPPIYTPDATMHELLGHMGIQLGVERRTMGRFDGWADFPESAAGAGWWPEWHIEFVSVDGQPVTT